MEVIKHKISIRPYIRSVFWYVIAYSANPYEMVTMSGMNLEVFQIARWFIILLAYVNMAEVIAGIVIVGELFGYKQRVEGGEEDE